MTLPVRSCQPSSSVSMTVSTRSKAVGVERHRCVVRFVRRAAHRVRHDDDTKAPVNRSEHGVSTQTSVSLPVIMMVHSDAARLLMQIAAGPGRRDVLVECAGRWNEPRELRNPARHCKQLSASSCILSVAIASSKH
jgi:hypothetical protein